MRAEGITRTFTGTLEHWAYAPLRDTQHAAREILRRMAARHPELGSSIDLSPGRG
jgi:mitochondrial fission protein ELM1